MEKRKALGAILILMMTALSGFSKAGAMELSPEEIESQEIASSFLQGSSNASILLRSMIAYQGELIELPGHESSIKMEGLYPQAWCVVIPRNAEVLWRECFRGRKSLVHVVFEFGAQLTRVEKYACAESSLCAIDIPASMRTLGEHCFTECPLGSIFFEPNSQLMTVRESAFSSSLLRFIVIPRSVRTLETSCFLWCSFLDSVTFEEESQLTRVGDGAFFGSGLIFINFPRCDADFRPCILQGSPITEILVEGVPADPYRGLHAGTMIIQTLEVSPDIECIRPFCFSGCCALTAVTFASDSRLVTIGGFALYETGLQSITLPKSVRILGEHCFARCSALTSCSFEAGSPLERIGKDTFAHSGLCTICIPASVRELGERCFAECQSFTSITFEADSQLESVEEYAFFYCSALQTVAFPASVQTLGKHCFLNCLSLVSVVCEAGSQLASVGVYAFRGCSALQAVTLPSKVKTFGERCFASCPSLTSVMCEAGSPPAEIGEGVFESSLQARFAFSHDGEQDEASSED